MSLKGRIALVTGSGGGIGREICLSLAKEGVKIIQFGGNNLDKLRETDDMITAIGGESMIFAGDITCDTVREEQFNAALGAFGGIDILINNAGIAHNALFADTPANTFDKIMNINARAPYLLTQLALPYLKKSDRASIINIASVVSHAGYASQSAYTASKHALLGFTKSLAAEVYQDGIRVHAISPGGVYTDMVKISRPDLKPDGMIMPNEIADVVMFLLKNRGNAVIDEIIVHRVNKTPFLV
jgi:NAD(P)-dependent dehydrogenase (short-subunit alcohol dehydrogenase family)